MTSRHSRRGFLSTGLALVVAGCATTPAIVPGETWPELEPLLAVTSQRGALTIVVSTKGCANRADFVFRVDRVAGRAVVAFARRRLETCQGAATRAALVFSYKELGLKSGERIVIANPIAPVRP